MTLVSRGALALLLACMSCLAQSGKTDEDVNKPSAKLEKMPQSLEVRFALSALPPHLRDGATSYVSIRTRATSWIARESTASVAS
jgi:hypothetical protein